ncbi:poly [ADP-ribose] polymerase [Drosophila nasuta]|uniref:Poly [ADP-ribose] polymerase n=1 Tax=Drosophila albomicans TaxID=7291 RepID=A0A6P8XH75_DROAB|nr:poly [ADP-ribose] polymerase [Drosophila albomicans]XP_060646288.1 poly [ADP-ribose] polymerase [Drosophila nasuta]
MDIELPYSVEYAKSGRASCKGCKTPIPKDSIRLAIMVQSPFHDGKVAQWYHKNCFFKKQRPASVGDIKNFENLRYADQKEVEKLIGTGDQIVESITGKKRSKEESQALKDFGIEYSKSGRASCRGCELKISKDEVRVSKTVYDTEVGMKYGGQKLWHHLECFAKMRSEVGWFDTGENLPGYKQLSAEDKSEVKKYLPAIKSEDTPDAKKPKLELEDESEQNEKDIKLKNQNDILFKFRDELKTSVKKSDIEKLLKYNKQEPILGDSEKLLDQAADLLAFGAIEACADCKSCQFTFNKFGYSCNGNISEWSKCTKVLVEPKRSSCKIPNELKLLYPGFKTYKKKKEIRIIQYTPPSASTIAKDIAIKKNPEELEGPKVKRERPPLYNFTFSTIGLKDCEMIIRKRIGKLGGKYDSKISEDVTAIISNEIEVEKQSSRMKKAKEFGIHILPMKYIDCVESDGSAALTLINSMTLCDWGTDPSNRIPHDEIKKSKSKSIYTKSVPKSMTLKVKNGLAVDPDSGLEDIAHVYVKGKNKYNIVLGLTDIQRNKNSYYKLQLLESDKQNKYWIFRSWGRIGTTIGNSKVENFNTVIEAIHSFNEVYAEKTGNEFENRNNFIKYPGRMYPIDIEYDDDNKLENAEQVSHIPSKLDIALQNLIKLIFDVDSMKKTMVEFHIDMEKMPLGKLSLKQLQSAYNVINEIYELILKQASNARFIDASNRFYTLIPHNFGVNAPPLIETVEQVESLRQMLDSLSEIEVAYNIIKNENNVDNINPVDKHYEQLKTHLVSLDKKSDEFVILNNYVQNTHASTHSSYELEVIDVFKVSRQGEARRFKPFKKLHNRKLLWHGSRLTNFVGILSHGLKIAPPEAPPTGYMFGKGIYFADMVSKSANYCCTSQQNSTGLMLLSEVALGDMMECTSAKYVKQLPKDKHSCYGRGRTMPNPKESHIRDDGVEIPLGKPITDDALKSSLLYNEFIVYDVAQVNVQYLFRLEFKYKY